MLRSLGSYWLHRKGFREYARFAIEEKYVYRTAPDASHRRILDLVERDGQQILDLGCGSGHLAEALTERGNVVVGVDRRRPEGVAERMDRVWHLEDGRLDLAG